MNSEINRGNGLPDEVEKILNMIERFSRGEAVVMGGEHDRKYIQGKIDKIKDLYPGYIGELETKLSLVDSDLSTWESRKKRKEQVGRILDTSIPMDFFEVGDKLEMDEWDEGSQALFGKLGIGEKTSD